MGLVKKTEIKIHGQNAYEERAQGSQNSGNT